MEQRIVHCVKLDKDLPGFDKPPLPGELGKRIYDSISKDAFKMFKDYFLMFVNEYRLDLSNTKTDEIFLTQAEEFLFGTGGEPPKEFVPEKQ